MATASEGWGDGCQLSAMQPKALNDSFTYCDGVYASLQDSHLADKVSVGDRHPTVLFIAMRNVAHNDEHYGNIVTYLRIKGLVPPSSMPM